MESRALGGHRERGGWRIAHIRYSVRRMTMKCAAAAVLCTFLTFGCGDDGSPENGPSTTGGTGGATGGAGSSSSGGSGAAPGTGGAANVVRGAISLNILGASCSLDDQFLDFPAVAGGHPVDGASVGELLEHGGTTADGEPVSLTCSWSDSRVNIGIDIGPTGDQFGVSLGSGTVVGETTQGGIALFSATLPDNYGSSAEAPCEYVPIEVDQAARSIWGMVSCGILDDSSGTDRCELGPSYFYFENCGE
jgi:hypothetical protein